MKKQRKSSLSTTVTIVTLLMVILSSSVIGILGYAMHRTTAIQYAAKNALDIATTVAAGIDPEQYAKTMAGGKNDAYWNSVKRFVNNVKVENGVKYLYIIDKKYDTQATYFIEARRPDEKDDAAVGKKEELSAFADEMYDTLKTGKKTQSAIYSSGTYGYLVSGFAPILDKDGNTIGVVGADTAMEAALADVDSFGIKIFVIIVTFLLLFGVLTLWFVRVTVKNPIKKIHDVSAGIAEGKMGLNIDIRLNNEIGDLARDFQKVVHTINDLIDSTTKTAKEQKEGNMDASIDDSAFTGAYHEMAVSINEMLHQNKQDTEEILLPINAIAKGDFHVAIRKFPGKKVGLSDAIESLTENLKTVSDDISLMTRSASVGDFSKRLDVNKYGGDWGSLANNLNYLLEAITEPIQESSVVLKQMSEGELGVKLSGDYKGDFALIKNSINATSTEIAVYITEIKNILAEIAGKNLSVDIQRNYVGQFNAIKDSINNIVYQFNLIFENISGSATEVAQGALQLERSSLELAREAEVQTNTVDELSHTIERISDQNGQNAANATRANEISTKAKQNAEEGNGQMKQMLTSMDSIKDASNNISKIIKVIEDIAFQTNLLALNAAVEAARAGQHGKGFAVVAEEVRNLANRSQQAVKSSAGLIADSIDRVNEGTKIANATAESLEAIMDSVSDVSTLVKEIKDSSSQQTESIEKLNQGLYHISEAVTKNSASSQEATSLSQVLSSQSADLKQLINGFKLKKR